MPKDFHAGSNPVITAMSKDLKHLFDIPRDSWIEVPNLYKEGEDKPLIVKFRHIDGMYSYCKDLEGNMIHLKALVEARVLSEKEVEEIIKK